MSKDMRTRITDALKDAMKTKDAARLGTLRLINAAIKDQDIALRAEGKSVSDPEILAILEKMLKQRQESARAYEEGGRLELAEREMSESKVIKDFLPAPLSAVEAEAAIEAAIAQTGAQSIRDMGKVMGVLKSRYTGQLDFGAVGSQLKARLA